MLGLLVVIVVPPLLLCLARSFRAPLALRAMIVVPPLLPCLTRSLRAPLALRVMLNSHSSAQTSPTPSAARVRESANSVCLLVLRARSPPPLRLLALLQLRVTGDLSQAFCLSGFERLSVSQLVSRLTAHGVPPRPNTSADSLRDMLLAHVFNADCVTGSDSLPLACEQVVAQLVIEEDDQVISAQLQLLRSLPHLMPLEPLRRLLTLLDIPFAPNTTVSKLRRMLKAHINHLAIGDEEIAICARMLPRSSRPRVGLPRTSRRSNHAMAMEEHLQQLASDWPVSSIAADLKDSLIAQFRDATSSAALATFVCACCAEACPSSLLRAMAFDDLPLDLLRSPSPSVTSSLTQIAGFSELDDILLDRAGVDVESREVRLCKSCHSALLREQLPSCALANNHYLGPTPPELSDLTPIEGSMIALCRAKAAIFQLRPAALDDSGSDAANAPEVSMPNLQRGMKGHVIIHPQHTEHVVDALPPSIQNIVEPVCIIFVGSAPPTRQWLLEKAKPLAVNRDRVLRALLWLKSHNPLDADIRIDYDVLASIPPDGLLPFTISTVPSSSAQDALTSRYDMVPGTANLDDNINMPSQSISDHVLPSVVITDVDGSAPSNESRAAAFRHVKESGGAFIGLPHDRAPANEFFAPSLFPKTFPTPFPYGIGGFENKSRSPSISMKNHVRHLVRLADRRFQEHPSFLFIVFNVLQRREVLLRSSLKARKASFHRVAEEFSLIPPETIQRICDRMSLNIPSDEGLPEDERRALRLMKEVILVSSAVQGSAAAKLNMRNELRASMLEHDVPSFYVTINPADGHSPILWFLTGDQVNINDWVESTASTYWVQSNRIAQNPFVAAHFFDTCMNAFISTLLGFKKTRNGTDDRGGILGPVKSYFGCVEAQGRGSLHCHMVIWLHGALNPNEIQQRILSGDKAFADRLAQFLDDQPDPVRCTEICRRRGNQSCGTLR